MFSSTPRLITFVALLTLALGAAANADDGVRLTTVAAQNGYTYQWIPTEAGATLARPGVRIVIRAGRTSYEVNNASPIADSAPHFDGRDLIISRRLAEHLRAIALKYPSGLQDPAASNGGGVSPEPFTSANAALTLYARHIPGREAIALHGTGPAGAQLEITLSGELSTDLPVVVLSRKIVYTAIDGSFSAEMDYGQDTHVKTTLTATVTTPSEGSSAVARVVIGVTSPQVTTSSLDDWPKK